MGGPKTYHSYGSAWANACTTPWRLYKHYEHEGGISTPCIVHWPVGIARRGAIDHRPCHLIDVMTTFIEVAAASYPNEIDGRPIMANEGTSLLPVARGEPVEPRTLFFEHEGNRSVRDGRWKLVAVKDGPWELYDFDTDRAEMHDLAATKPELVGELEAKWNAWAKQCFVLPKPGEAKPGPDDDSTSPRNE